MRTIIIIFLLLISNIRAQNDFPKLEKPPEKIWVTLDVSEGTYVIIYLKRYWTLRPMYPTSSDTIPNKPIMYLSRVFEGIAHEDVFSNSSSKFVNLDLDKMIQSDTGWVYQDSIPLRCVIFPIKKFKMLNPKNVPGYPYNLSTFAEAGDRIKYKDFYAKPKYEKALIADITFVPDLNYYSEVTMTEVIEHKKKKLVLNYGRTYYTK